MSQLQTRDQKSTTIAAMLISKSFKDQMDLALPAHMTADRLSRIALTEVRKNPKLAQCTLESFASSALIDSQLGLEIGSAFGQGYLVPFAKNIKKHKSEKDEWVQQCQYIIGYRGMIQLVHKSGQIESIHADVVYEDDYFDYEHGVEIVLKHKPSKIRKSEVMTHAYAYAHLTNGGFEFVVMEKQDIDKIRESSKSAHIWDQYYEEMAKKTALRRLFKMLPVSAKIVRAISHEDAKETGNMSLLADFGGDDFIEVLPVKKSKSDSLAEEIGHKKTQNSLTIIEF